MRTFGGLLLAMALAAAVLTAAEGIDLAVSTPAIQKVRAAMQAREEQLNPSKAFGQLGEGKDGLLAVRTLEGVSLADKKKIEDLVAAENADRRTLYREILQAHGLKEEDAGKVMALAAQAHRKAAQPGQYVQDPRSGDWKLARDVKE